MGDYAYGSGDEENVELKKLNAEVVSLHSTRHKDIAYGYF